MALSCRSLSDPLSGACTAPWVTASKAGGGEGSSVSAKASKGKGNRRKSTDPSASAKIIKGVGDTIDEGDEEESEEDDVGVALGFWLRARRGCRPLSVGPVVLLPC